MKLFYGLSCLIFVATLGSVRADNRVVCYFVTWAHSFSGDGKFLPADIDPSLCTHFTYFSVGVDATNGRITLLDPKFDIDGNGLADFAALKNKNSKLTTLVALDAINTARDSFESILPNVQLRKAFVTNAVGFLQEFNIGGLDIVYEASTPKNKANFVNLMNELQSAFKPKGLTLALSAAESQKSIENSYNVPALNSLVDYINVLTLDYYMELDGVTGANAPLRPQPTDPKNTSRTVSASIERWLKSGATPSKINLAIATYGHTFTLKDPTKSGTGVPVTGPGPAGLYTQDKDTWTYHEICTNINANNKAWKIVNQDNSYVYAVNNKLWIAYDDVSSAKAKGAYAKSKGLGGINIYNLHGDDFRGRCGSKNPIITAAAKGLKGL